MDQDKLIAVVNEQAKDPWLWSYSSNPRINALQAALRRMHEIVEGKTSEQCARAVLD